MTYINSTIQKGFLRRFGWRGRWLTVYAHLYGGQPEESERYHSHPWRWAISIVVTGRIVDHTNRSHRIIKHARYPLSIKIYRQETRHRIFRARKGSKTLFIGLFRSQKPIPGATEQYGEGYGHYTESDGFHNARKDK